VAEGRLPDDVPPMLAKTGKPFDSEAWLFEVKWDGVRAVAYVDREGLRIHSRHRRDLAPRYPELDVLRQLPPGTILDGELCAIGTDGKPDFHAALTRETARGRRLQLAARSQPITYVVFDLLYLDFAPLLDQPLQQRRARLQELFATFTPRAAVCPEGTVGEGRKFFAAIEARGLEGMVGKRLDSRYLPGERTDAWLKVKCERRLHCLILGFEPEGEDDFKSLIVATNDEGGTLRCVGRVGSGFSDVVRARLRTLLFERLRDRPLIDAGISGRWIEPGLYCSVQFLEWTAHGNLRGPVFLGLIEERA
jgi:bifunctional non-homologous end joining protein LigD